MTGEPPIVDTIAESTLIKPIVSINGIDDRATLKPTSYSSVTCGGYHHTEETTGSTVTLKPILGLL